MITQVRWIQRPYLLQNGEGVWETHPTENIIVEVYNGKWWSRIAVPPGFVCDGASIPLIGLFRTFLPKSRANNAGVIHDYLYGRKAYYSRKDSDEIFRKLLELEEFDSRYAQWKWRAIGVPMAYWAVRVFGRFFFKGRDV